MSRASKLFALILGCAFLPGLAHADTFTYTYTGNAYSPFSSSPYSSADSVTGTMILSAPLAASFSGFVTPISFSFSDGVQTITSANSQGSDTFEFILNASGNLTAWYVNLIGASTDYQIRIQELGTIEDESTYGGSLLGANSNSPGTWVLSSSSVSSTPEPGGLLLMGTGGITAMVESFRRRLKRS